MISLLKVWTWIGVVSLVILLCSNPIKAQEKLKLSYSSVDASNAVWFVAKERGFYQKHGLEPELVFILSATTSVASLVAGDVKAGNASAGAVTEGGKGSGEEGRGQIFC